MMEQTLPYPLIQSFLIITNKKTSHVSHILHLWINRVRTITKSFHPHRGEGETHNSNFSYPSQQVLAKSSPWGRPTSAPQERWPSIHCSEMVFFLHQCPPCWILYIVPSLKTQFSSVQHWGHNNCLIPKWHNLLVCAHALLLEEQLSKHLVAFLPI